MRRLSDDERTIRSSRGIPIGRLLPFIVPVIVLLVMSADQRFLERCLGHRVEVLPYAGSGWARLVAAIFCSPYYLRDFSAHWVGITVFAISVAFAIPQIFWLKRHKAYWDSVRQKEKLKRAEKRVKKQADQETPSTSDDM